MTSALSVTPRLYLSVRLSVCPRLSVACRLPHLPPLYLTVPLSVRRHLTADLPPATSAAPPTFPPLRSLVQLSPLHRRHRAPATNWPSRNRRTPGAARRRRLHRRPPPPPLRRYRRRLRRCRRVAAAASAERAGSICFWRWPEWRAIVGREAFGSRQRTRNPSGLIGRRRLDGVTRAVGGGGAAAAAR